MKLDIFDNSIQLFVMSIDPTLMNYYELSRGVDRGGSSHFPGGKLFEYILGPTSEGVITATFSGLAIRLGVRPSDLALFASRGRLSLCAEIPFNKTKPLRVVIERDFDN
jgi:hypothetical protein